MAAMPLRRSVLLTGLAAPVLAAAARPLLRVLAWPGYAEPEVVQAFERETGARVELTVIDTDEALWQRLSARGGVDFDLVSMNVAELARSRRAGLLQPVQTALVPATQGQLPRFRDWAAIPGLVQGEGSERRVYGIPYTYAEMGLVYDRRQLEQAPTSIGALWDPRWRGRVLAYNGGSHSFSLAALRLGLSSPFQLAAGDWPNAVQQLIGLRRNVLGFYTQPEESLRLFRRHRVALMFANYGSQQLRLLQDAGAEVGYAIPREGALAWLDCWAITRTCAQPALAHAWINQLLGEQAAGLLTSRQGLASTLRESASAPAGARLHWLQPVEDANRRERLWDRIRAGSTADRVLAP